MCNYVKFDTGRNLLRVLKIVTHTVQLCVDKAYMQLQDFPIDFHTSTRVRHDNVTYFEHLKHYISLKGGVCNYVKFKTGRNLLRVLKMVTCTVQLCIDISLHADFPIDFHTFTRVRHDNVTYFEHSHELDMTMSHILNI